MNRKFLWIVVSVMVIVLTGCTVTDTQQTTNDNAPFVSKEFEEIKHKADAGDVQSQLALGGYFLLDGVQQDYKQANFWFRKAADQGLPIAQLMLGTIYLEGLGVKQDNKQAMMWFRKAADQSNANAQYNLGIGYSEGRGVKQDFNAAVGWYRKAADQGHAGAQNNLGLSYYKGQGVEKNYKIAVVLYLKAAEQGYAGAQNNLGIMYCLGEGVIEDYVESYKWFLLAGMNGADVGKQKSLVVARMTPSQIAEAQRLAKEFVPKVEGATQLGEQRLK